VTVPVVGELCRGYDVIEERECTISQEQVAACSSVLKCFAACCSVYCSAVFTTTRSEERDTTWASALQCVPA